MKVKIEKEVLNISIPLGHIKAGLEGHPYDAVNIKDVKKMGKFFKNALLNETMNDGETTVFEDMLDKIGNIALESGEEWLELEDY